VALAEIVSTFQVGTELADQAPFLNGATRTEVPRSIAEPS
jgi:hypothetical protein